MFLAAHCGQHTSSRTVEKRDNLNPVCPGNTTAAVMKMGILLWKYLWATIRSVDFSLDLQALLPANHDLYMAVLLHHIDQFYR